MQLRKVCTPRMIILRLVITAVSVIIIPSVDSRQQRIPTTLEGPFEPVTRRFDPSLRSGSDDLSMDHPRLRRNVTGMVPEQIALALSTPTSVWVSWVTGIYIHTSI